jgi:hypothetical protein
MRVGVPGALAVSVLGCSHGAELRSADRGTDVHDPGAPSPAASIAPAAGDAAAHDPSIMSQRPPAAPAGSRGAMSKTVAIKGMAGVEHLQPDDSFVAYLPGTPVPTPIRTGDRLRVHLEVAGDAWIYAMSVIREADYRSLGVWPPDRHASTGTRVLWPGGHALTADEAAMTTLLVIASRDELPWARDLTRADCASLVDKRPPDPPITACDHLYGLFWKIPPRPRGMVPPVVGAFQDGETRMPAIVAEHSGAPYTAIEWQFKPRK